MRVLVTGGAGFIGHHLIAALLRDGHEVVAFDNFRRGRFKDLATRGVTRVRGDVRDAVAVSEAARGCAAIVHLAAEATVMGSERDSNYAFETNVTGTWHVARSALEHGCRVIFSSSREVYGNAVHLPVPESAPRAPQNVYGLTKCLGEDVLTAPPFSDVPVSILRLANVVGPGDADRVVPRWLNAARNGIPLPLHGGTQVIDFVPVGVVVRAILSSLSCSPMEGPVNVGSGVGTTLLELIARIESAVGRRVEVERLPSRPVEVESFIADTSRLRTVLGIDPPGSPLATLETGWAT